MSLALQLDLFKSSLPRKPYCTDDLGVLHIRPAATALQRRYIQHNPPPVIAWLVFDIDKCSAVEAWECTARDDEKLPQLPPPAWIASNPCGIGGHIAYGISSPVARTDAARDRPLRFAAAVEYAYRQRLGADRGYAGLVTKNPVHKHWRVYTPSLDGGVYDLAELSEYVNLPKKIPRRDQEVGIGRNVSLFDNLRQWSYSAVRQYWRPDGYNAWLEACVDRASDLNQFATPLPYQEVRGIGRSVAKWVWKNFTPMGFRQVQSGRGVRSGEVRRKGSISEAKPWESEGISRATWYRRQSNTKFS